MRLVLFDCDGTLVDSQVMIVTAMTRAFEAAALAPPPREEILSIVGLSLPIAVGRLSARHPDAPVGALVDAYKSAFQDLRASNLHQEPLYPGVRETLQSLSSVSDSSLGIVTGKSRRGVDAILALHGLASYFHVIKTADGSPSKPHPGMVLEAMAECGADAARTVVIGDTTFDMEMARSAGARAVGVAWGYHPTDALAAAGAERMVHRFPDIPAAVSALIGE